MNSLTKLLFVQVASASSKLTIGHMPSTVSGHILHYLSIDERLKLTRRMLFALNSAVEGAVEGNLAEQLRVHSGARTLPEAFDDFIQFNGPELMTALENEFDIAMISQVVTDYLDCLAIPYCKYMPKGLRSPQGVASMTPDFQKFMHPQTGKFVGFADDDADETVVGYIDDMIHAKGDTVTHEPAIRVLMRADHVPVLISASDVHILPLHRMIIRKTETPEVLIWRAGSDEPLKQSFGPEASEVNATVEISPDHKQLILQMSAVIGSQRSLTHLLVNTDPFKNSFAGTYADRLAGTLAPYDFAYSKARFYSGTWVLESDRGCSDIDGALSKSLAQRDQELLAFFQEFMTDGGTGAGERYAFLRQTFNDFIRRYGRWLDVEKDERTSVRYGLLKIYWAIRDHETEETVLSAIKAFLKGIFYAAENTNGLEAWVMGVMLRERSVFEKTAQESWDSYIYK